MYSCPKCKLKITENLDKIREIFRIEDTPPAKEKKMDNLFATNGKFF